VAFLMRSKKSDAKAGATQAKLRNLTKIREAGGVKFYRKLLLNYFKLEFS
jgi:hypothetical protein